MRKIILTFLFCLIFVNVYAGEIKQKSIGQNSLFTTELGQEKDEVLIGDENSPNDFKPKITLTKWDKEENLSIRYYGMDNASLSKSNEKITLGNSDKEFYVLPYDSEILKFGLIFKTKPASNVFEFKLEGWQDFDFFYQDTLENDYANNVEVKPGETLEHYLATTHRPDDVVGSYAVYHKNKKNNKYKAGKFCHIYRPRFIDADGKFTWGILNITNGTYTVTIPQEFLDTAVYPVKANDTVGYSTLGASTNALGDSALLARYDADSPPTGTLSKIYFGGRSSSGSDGDIQLGVYTDDTTAPSAKVAVTAALAIGTSTTAAWHPGDSPNGQAITGNVTNGTRYWSCAYGHNTTGHNIDKAYDTGGVSGQSVSITSGITYPTWPDPFGTHTDSTAKYSLYFETVDGGATTSTPFFSIISGD